MTTAISAVCTDIIYAPPVFSGLHNSSDDLDAPNTQPGWCPDCGQSADIWEAVTQHWECRLCDWKGRKPNPTQKESSK